jgi:EpsI family protein
MKIPNTRHIAIGIAMLVTAGLALALTPPDRVAAKAPRPDLDAMIPSQFADWKQEGTLDQIMVNPEKKQFEATVYDQTLARLYVNGKNQRVMLSIAYGGSYGKEMQPHRPEVCYPSQGFTVAKENQPEVIQTPYGELQVKRLVATGPRTEPITYWIVVGDSQTRFGLKMRLLHLRYSLTGQIPEGMLVRVSSVGEDDREAYRMQENFIQGLVAAVSDKDRPRVVGQF